jgi:two-component system chemotaxis sensor kinase CheA
VKELIDRLSEAFLLTEMNDLPGLKVLRHRVDELLPLAADAAMAETLVDLGMTLDVLMTGQDPVPANSWAALEKGIRSLQERPSDIAPAAVPPRELDPEIVAGFIVEAREHLDAAEAQLLVLESDPAQVEAVHTVFRAFHTIKGAAGCLDLNLMQSLAHETENLLDLARHGGITLTGASLDLVFQAVDAMKRLVEDLETLLKTGTPRPADPALEPLVVRIRQQVGGQGDSQAAPEPAPAPSLEESPSELVTASSSGEETTVLKESVRVDAQRLDRLVDLIGELVIAESMVSQSGELRSLTHGLLGRSVSQLDKITRELQQIGMSLRMVPVRPLFQKMARLARDLSRKLAKPVEFTTSGEEIEIDKAIVNCVTDALVHILRNALDHGIERDADERARAGKAEVGRLELRAAHREGSIVIEVEDDGAGLDRAAILAKGIEKGLVRKGDNLNDEEVFRLIFLPGFSTAKVITELSGRGVGLDVVRTSVEALRGRIEVHSRRGRGTLFRIRLPLTLAIIDGMVIRAGRERFIVPTLSITRLVRPEASQRSTSMERGELLSIQDDLIPQFRLRRLLDVNAAPGNPDSEVVVVVEESGRRVGLLADEVLGQQQIVIKSLGLNLEGVHGISGGVILPDGQVGLILDVAALLAQSTAPLQESAR